jgi:hypothetical protein
MPMNGLPPGLLNPPPPVAPDAEARLKEHGWMGSTPGTMILVLVFLAAFACTTSRTGSCCRSYGGSADGGIGRAAAGHRSRDEAFVLWAGASSWR